MISPKRKFNQSSILPHNGFNNLFTTVQETTHFMEVGWLKKTKQNKTKKKKKKTKKKKIEMHGDVPVSDMQHAFRVS